MNSILFDLHFDTCKTWVLPHVDMLYIIMYQGDAQEQAMEQGQAILEEEPREDGLIKIMPVKAGTTGVLPVDKNNRCTTGPWSSRRQEAS